VTHCSTDLEKLHQQIRTFKRALPIEEHFLKTIDKETTKRIISREYISILSDMYTSGVLVPIDVAGGIIVTVPQLPSFLTELESYLDSLGMVYMVTGNVGSGHISVTMLFDSNNPDYSSSILLYSKNIFSIVQRYNGGISATSGEGLSRTPYMLYAYNDSTLALFKKIKEVWDPLLILNPGKKTSITTNYLKQHIRHGGKKDTFLY
jgi:FAD/FMN-containing dehydrogenase